MKQLELLEIKTLAEVGEDIGLTEGLNMINAFRAVNPEATKGYYIGKNILEQILQQPGCVGINFRKGLNELNQEHLVYTGVDENGKDILEFSVVTSSGKYSVEKGIVADKIWQLDEETLIEID